jgi:hypothetical protein
MDGDNRCIVMHMGDVYMSIPWAEIGPQDRSVAWRMLNEIVKEEYSDRLQGRRQPLAVFNDHPDTTKAEVLAVIEKASARFEETT